MTTEKPEIPASPKQVNGQEVLEALESLSTDRTWGGMTTPRAFTILEVAKQILGFDPSLGQQNAAYGGKSPAGWYGQYLSVARLRSVMLELVSDGVVTEIVGVEDRAVRTPYRLGPKGRVYVPTPLYEASTAALEAARRDVERKKILKEAERAFLDLHAAEIRANYEARCAAAGLEPDFEGENR